MKKPKIWIGKEQEGLYTGEWTLFVGDYNVSFKEIDKLLKEHHYVVQIYFGAGGCTAINQKIVKEVIKKYNHTNLIVTCEIDIDELHLYKNLLIEDINCIVTFNHSNFIYLNEGQIKLQNLIGRKKVIKLFAISDMDEVDCKLLKDKIYEGDEVIR